MVPRETSDERIVPNEDSKPVSDHTLHSQLVIPVSWLGIVGMCKRFLPITLYHVKRGPRWVFLISSFLESPFEPFRNQSQAIPFGWQVEGHTAPTANPSCGPCRDKRPWHRPSLPQSCGRYEVRQRGQTLIHEYWLTSDVATFRSICVRGHKLKVLHKQ